MIMGARPDDEYNELKKLPMPELLSRLEDMFKERDEWNKTRSRMDEYIGREDSDVKKFIEYVEKIKKCVDDKQFTDGFEQSMKLKIWFEGLTKFNLFVGDSQMGSILRAIIQIITSRFFKSLETMENNIKLEGKNFDTNLLN